MRGTLAASLKFYFRLGKPGLATSCVTATFYFKMMDVLVLGSVFVERRSTESGKGKAESGNLSRRGSEN